MALDHLDASPDERLAAALANDLKAVNEVIRARMSSRHAPRIPEVTAHLVEAGGKRIRPLLTLAAARMFDYSGPHHVNLAATVEFIHTATLLHDDVVDESSRRRGRPTANLLWDNRSSILVGDFLFSRSFQLMVETDSLRVLEVLANAAAMISEGEVLQLTASHDLQTDQDLYLTIIQGKTAALFSAATEAGGVISGADDTQIRALRNYGNALGIAYQITDDLLDYGGEAEATGKAVGNDFRQSKLTLPAIIAIAKADSEELAFWTRVIEKANQQAGDFEHALSLLTRHSAMDEAKRDANHWASQAKDAILELPPHEFRDMLHDLADHVVARLS